MRRFVVTLFLLLASCASQQKPPERSFPVILGDVTQRDVPIYIEAIGNVYTLQFVQVRPQVGGIIQEAYVKQGQYVKKGDPLYKIDPRPYEAALEKAKAQLVKDTAAQKFAEIRVERYADLVKKEYFSKLNYDQFTTDAEAAQGQVISDEADITTASLNLEWTVPKSPIDGKISQYNLDPGNLVQANDPNALTDIRQIDPAEVRFGIVQSDFVAVQNAMKNNELVFQVILPQDPDHPRTGTIYFIDNHIDTTTGTILFKGTVPNADEFLWPGEFVRIRLQLRVEKDGLIVPQEAVWMGQEGPFVYVYNPETSKVDYRLVQKGPTADNMTLIEKGVKAGEKVVVKGQINLRPGVKVYMADNAKAEKRATP